MSQIRFSSEGATVKSPELPQESSAWPRLRRNLRGFLTRFITLARNPRQCAPILVDYWLLLQSTWSRRQLGPDVVYPLLSITKRHSGRLARLILEHSMDASVYALRSSTEFPQGIHPPCVAVIDLDDAPQRVGHNRYTTHSDLFGLVWMMIFLQISVALITHVSFLGDKEQDKMFLIWTSCVNFSLFFCTFAAIDGEGILTLARRSDTSTPGSAVLLDQEFTVVLNGNQTVVEAISESNFSFCNPNAVLASRRREERVRHSSYDILEALCDASFFSVLVLCGLLFRPPGVWPVIMLLFVVAISVALGDEKVIRISPLCIRVIPVAFIILQYVKATGLVLIGSFKWQLLACLISVLAFDLLAVSRVRNYPIRTEAFLDALGNPQVRKWEFNTFAAAATFQCLVFCRGITRPIRTIDIFAFLDMLVPDQRDIWKVWKARVADRIVHETDIKFAPVVPTFGDERQRQLKELLDEAQFGYDTYRRFFDDTYRDTPLNGNSENDTGR